ncbi:MAG TPA: 50S ribosomal protein L4 [candidate division Zixibacteria bacterium]|nr:50S ribosomal protein L4 [candidate division Zixibacteria bacterium]
MPKGILLDREGKNIGSAELPEMAFGIEPNSGLVHQYVECYLANQRLGLHCKKTSAEVSGGGRKPWRQKGTGRARVGSIRSPLWRHGGLIFAPKPRDYRKAFPRKMRRLALASVLSARTNEQGVFVFEDIDSNNHKTANLKAVLQNAGVLGKKVLIVTNSPEMNLVRAGRNLDGVEVTFAGELNTYQALRADIFMATKGALEKIEELCKR